MLNINELLQIKFNCDCGATHCCSTKNVIFGKNLADEFLGVCKSLLGAGHIAVAFFEDCKQYAKYYIDVLISEGYKVTEICYASLTYCEKESCQDMIDTPEDVRLFVGIGSATLSSMLKYCATSKNIPSVYIATSPSSISLFDESCTFCENGCFQSVDVQAHQYIFLDYQIILKCPQEHIASGFGEIISESLNYFEKYFQNIVGKKTNCCFLQQIKRDAFKDFYDNYNNSTNIIYLICNMVVTLGLIRQLEKEKMLYSIDIIANCIQQKGIEAKPLGINKFLAYVGMVNYYKNVLSYEKVQVSLDTDIIKKCYNYSRLFDCESYNIFCSIPQKNLSLSNLCIYEEYKEDFLNIINGMYLKSTAYMKHFRRLFDDVGFWLFDYITASDLLESIQNSSIMCADTSILSIADFIGLGIIA